MERLDDERIALERDLYVEPVVGLLGKQVRELRMAVVVAACFEQDAVDSRGIGVVGPDVGSEISLERSASDERVTHERLKGVSLRECNGHELILLGDESSKKKKLLQALSWRFCRS